MTRCMSLKGNYPSIFFSHSNGCNGCYILVYYAMACHFDIQIFFVRQCVEWKVFLHQHSFAKDEYFCFFSVASHLVMTSFQSVIKFFNTHQE